jgi:DeoR/GlpR family transcriptional regulator of sugar metabolism
MFGRTATLTAAVHVDPTGDPAPAFADERRQRIADLVATRGRARIGELAVQFAVTQQTVRRDLGWLQEQGLLRRTYGGAIARRSLDDPELAEREALHEQAKQRIARACVRLLRDGDSVFLDSGTIVASIARELRAAGDLPSRPLRNLSVLTNVPEVAREIAGTPTFEHVLLGGRCCSQGGAVIGALALENLQRFKVDVAFIGVSAFSEDGISVASIAEAELKAAVIGRARHVVVPLDSSKAGATDFARICDLDEIDTVVMNHMAPETVQLCRAHEIRPVIAGEGRGMPVGGS